MPNGEHRQAEQLASKASLLMREGSVCEAKEYYKQAARSEKAALEKIDAAKKRTRGILAVSLVSMLYKAGEHDEAEREIFARLAHGDLPGPAKGQLRELLESVWDDRAVMEQGYEYSGEVIQFSLRGGRVGAGTAPMDTLVQEMRSINSLLYRTAEFQGEFPFRQRGEPPDEVKAAMQARTTQPLAGSYCFSIKLLRPSEEQLQLFEENTSRIDPREVSRILVGMMKFATDEVSHETLVELVPDKEYRTALLKLMRNILPGGRDIKEMEVKRMSGDHTESIIMNQFGRPRITETLRALREKPNQEDEIKVRGTLRGVHLDRNWLVVVSEDGEEQKCHTEGDVYDDVVGPLVNHKVVVYCKPGMRGARRRLTVKDLELDEGVLDDAPESTAVKV